MEIKLIRADITTVKADVIVNAANTSLLGGGGVDGAIHRAGGPAILQDCQKIQAQQGGCKVGEAVITTAGDLPAIHVIHTVGPRWNQGRSGEAEKLASCYRSVLELASSVSARTVAIPNISTGIYGYPKKEAAKIAVATVKEHEGDFPEEVIFVCYDLENYDMYDLLLTQLR